MFSAAVGQTNLGIVRVRLSNGLFWIGGSDTDVVPRLPLHQFAPVCDRPFFQMRRKPVRVIEQEVRCDFVLLVARKFRCAHQARDDCRQCRRRVTGILLPTFLRRHRPVQNQITRGARDQRPGIELPESVCLLQSPGEQNRHRHFIQLNSFPVSLAHNRTVLRQAAIGSLDTRQPDQRAQRRLRLPAGQQCRGGLHHVARPDQMIPAAVAVILRIAPRNTQRRDERALARLVFMRQQNALAQA